MRQKGKRPPKGALVPLGIAITCALIGLFGCIREQSIPDQPIEMVSHSDTAPEQYPFLDKDGYLLAGTENTPAYKAWLLGQKQEHRFPMHYMLISGERYETAVQRLQAMSAR